MTEPDLKREMDFLLSSLARSLGSPEMATSCYRGNMQELSNLATRQGYQIEFGAGHGDKIDVVMRPRQKPTRPTPPKGKEATSK